MAVVLALTAGLATAGTVGMATAEQRTAPAAVSPQARGEGIVAAAQPDKDGGGNRDRGNGNGGNNNNGNGGNNGGGHRGAGGNHGGGTVCSDGRRDANPADGICSRDGGRGPNTAAAARAADAAARAEEAAQDASAFAEARSRAAETWDGRGRPARLLIVRDGAVDVVEEGRLTGRSTHVGTSLSLEALDHAAPADWVVRDEDVARLGATVVLGQGSTLHLDGVPTVQLTGGPAPADVSSIFTGGGRLIANGVTVTSVDPATDEAMGPGPGRPFVVVSSGGRVDATDTTFSDLGTQLDQPDSHAGVQLNEGSTGSLVRTTLARNSIGLRLDRSEGVQLEGLMVRESVGNGLELRGDLGTTLRDIRAEENGANGVLLTAGAPDRLVTGIRTTGNLEYGIATVGMQAPRIVGVETVEDGTGGLRLDRTSGPVVTDLIATDQPIGVFTHVGTRNVVIEGARITGGRRGIVIEKSTTGLVLRRSTIEGARTIGVALGGHDTLLEDVTVADSGTAVRVERGAGGVTAIGLKLAGGDDGFVANPGSEHVALRGLVADGIGNVAVRTYSPETEITGARITGADTGIVTGAATTVADTAITEVDAGVRARDGALARLDRIDVAALTLGVDVAPGTPVQLHDSRVHALEALRGEVVLVGPNDLSLPPLNLLGVVGVPLVILALLLEVAHVIRQRRAGVREGVRGLPPRREPATVGA